jgi:hypothetical protein
MGFIAYDKAHAHLARMIQEFDQTGVARHEVWSCGTQKQVPRAYGARDDKPARALGREREEKGDVLGKISPIPNSHCPKSEASVSSRAQRA